MSLILSTGSNLGDRELHLNKAKELLSKNFSFIAASNIYQSPAVDYLNQPDFLNQVLEFELPTNYTEHEVLNLILEIEKELGRVRDIPKGPRTLDIDILFWGLINIDSENLIVPHPRLFDRSFIVYPLMELPFASTLKSNFKFSNKFKNTAEIYKLNA